MFKGEVKQDQKKMKGRSKEDQNKIQTKSKHDQNKFSCFSRSVACSRERVKFPFCLVYLCIFQISLDMLEILLPPRYRYLSCFSSVTCSGKCDN